MLLITVCLQKPRITTYKLEIKANEKVFNNILRRYAKC